MRRKTHVVCFYQITKYHDRDTFSSRVQPGLVKLSEIRIRICKQYALRTNNDNYKDVIDSSDYLQNFTNK